MVDLLERKLIFVTGKGGVGKTTIAAALAWLAAGRGQRTLVCEVDAKGNLADFFETAPIRFEEREIAPRLVGHVDGHRGVAQAVPVAAASKLPLVARIGPLAKMFDFVAIRRARGQGDRHRRQAVLGGQGAATTTWSSSTPPPAGTSSASWPPRRPSTSWCRSGLVRQQTGWMLDILDDPATTGLVVVATPAEMPVSETLELTARLRERDQCRSGCRGGQPGPARAVRPGGGGGVRPAGEPRRRKPGSTPPSAVARRPLMEAARLTVTMRRSRTEHLETLRAAVDPSVPLLYVPYLFFRSHGLRATHQLADALSGELGY